MNNRPKQHYVNNVDFFKAIVEYKNACAKADKAKKDRPRIPEYIGRCFLEIADRLSTSPRFRRYTWRDDLIGDACEDCVLRIHSFKPEVSSNAFSYFTQICWFAFFRRINKEYKQSTVKAEIIRNSGVLTEMMNTRQVGDDGQNESNFLSFLIETTDSNALFREQQGENKGKFVKTTKAHQARLKAQGKKVEVAPVKVKKPKIPKDVKIKMKEAEELEKLMLKDIAPVLEELIPEEVDDTQTLDVYYDRDE